MTAVVVFLDSMLRWLHHRLRSKTDVDRIDTESEEYMEFIAAEMLRLHGIKAELATECRQQGFIKKEFLSPTPKFDLRWQHADLFRPRTPSPTPRRPLVRVKSETPGEATESVGREGEEEGEEEQEEEQEEEGVEEQELEQEQEQDDEEGSASLTPTHGSSTSSPPPSDPIPRPGDLVFRFRPTRLIIHDTCDSADLWDGPFAVASTTLQHWVQLQLPEGSKTPAWTSITDTMPAPPHTHAAVHCEESGGTYVVDKVRAIKGSVLGRRSVLVHWKGWGSEDDTWEPERELPRKFLREFEKRERIWQEARSKGY